MKHPCPMCGVIKTQEEDERENREYAGKINAAFRKGRRSINHLSTRENEVIDCILDLEMSFDEAAENFGIPKKQIYTYWQRGIKKIENL